MIDGNVLFHRRTIKDLADIGIDKEFKAVVLLDFLNIHRNDGVPTHFLVPPKGMYENSL